MDTENNNEVKETKVEEISKPKRDWKFTLFACVATAIIVALSCNIGNKLAKEAESTKGNSGNKEVVTSNSNVTSDVNSNSNSNVTSNANQSVDINGFYIGEKTIPNETLKITTELTINKDNSCTYVRSPEGSEPKIYKGTCEVKDSKLVFTAKTLTSGAAAQEQSSNEVLEFTIKADKILELKDSIGMITLNKFVTPNITGTYEGKEAKFGYKLTVSGNSCSYTIYALDGGPVITHEGTCKIAGNHLTLASTEYSNSTGNSEKEDMQFAFIINSDGTLEYTNSDLKKLILKQTNN